jgi:hypothetical protein
MLAVGPFIFYAWRRRKPPDRWCDKVPLEQMEKKGVWGYKALLLVSYAVTLVAVTGQIGALTLLGCEITSGSSWHIFVIVIGAVLALFARRSFWVVTYGQVKVNWDTKAQAQEDPDEQPLNAGHQPILVTTVSQ